MRLNVKSIMLMVLGLSAVISGCFSSEDVARAKCDLSNIERDSGSRSAAIEDGFGIFEGTVVSKKVSSSKTVEAEVEISWALHDVVEIGTVVTVETPAHDPGGVNLYGVDLEVGKHYRIAAVREDDATETWETVSWFGTYDTENRPVCD